MGSGRVRDHLSSPTVRGANPRQPPPSVRHPFNFTKAENMIRTDPETGLPKLPTSYIWRVSDGGDLYRHEYVRVELVQQRIEIIPRKVAFFGRRVLREEQTIVHEKVVKWTFCRIEPLRWDRGEPLEQRIRKEAHSVYREYFMPPQAPDVSHVLGDYPPKSLDKTR